MLVVFSCVALTVGFVLLVYPQTFSSEGRIFVRLGRESVSLDPTATTAGEVVSLNESRESEILSVVEFLRSRTLVEQVADEIGCDVLLGTKDSSGEFCSPGSRARDKAIDQLSKSIDVSNVKRSNVIAVTARARTPELAQRITATFLDAYIRQHLQVYSNPGSLDFFRSQVDLLRQDLEDAERAISQRKSRLNVLSIEGKRSGLLNQISDVEVELLVVDRGLTAAVARQQALEATLAQLPAVMLSEEVSGLPNAAADSMRSQLYALEIRERELQSTLKDNHPKLVAIRRQIEESREVLTGLPEQRQQKTHRLNDNAESLRFELLSEAVNVSSLQARQSALLAQREVLSGELEQFNHDEIEIASLQRKVDRLTTEFTLYSERLEQSRIGAALMEQEITNVSVVQPATLSLKPISPNRRMLAALGLVLATASAVGMALIGDMLKPTIDTPEQLESYLGLPVLASVSFDKRFLTWSGSCGD